MSSRTPGNYPGASWEGVVWQKSPHLLKFALVLPDHDDDDDDDDDDESYYNDDYEISEILWGTSLTMMTVTVNI